MSFRTSRRRITLGFASGSLRSFYGGNSSQKGMKVLMVVHNLSVLSPVFINDFSRPVYSFTKVLKSLVNEGVSLKVCE